MLSQTLKGLERDGLVSRTVVPVSPVAVEYALTPLGETLVSTIEALQRWARAHIGEVSKAQARYDQAEISSADEPAPRLASCELAPSATDRVRDSGGRSRIC